MRLCLVRFYIAFSTIAALVAFGPQLFAADKRPNILVIVGDDMGYADVGVHGCKDIPTPNLDALAASGTRCTNGYVSGPYCSPTRAGLLTGRYQTRFGHEFNPGGGNPAKGTAVGTGALEQDEALEANNIGLPTNESTIAKRLHDAGYATGLVGKWHLGSLPRFQPQKRGFDEFFGFLGGAHGYFPDARPLMLRGTERSPEKEYLTDAFGREAVSFIDKHAESDKPFFLYLAFNAVHTPMNATDARLEKFKKIEEPARRTYAAMMSALDENVGKVLTELKAKKLDENTLVFFISDNGGPTMPGTSINASMNDPLRGSKRTTLEGGIRVPYFVRWPGHVPAGKMYDQPVIQLDILPTALAAAGASANAKLDGVDLVPYLTSGNKAQPHDMLYWRFGQQMAVRQGDWKLVRYDPAADGKPGAATEARLYNLKDDIGETLDLVKAEPAKAKELQAAWDTWNELNVPALWGNGGGANKPRTGGGARTKKAAQRAAAGKSVQ